MNIRGVVTTALFASLIIVGSFIVIPVGVVPITLQTLFVLLAGVLAGKKIALSATSLYLVLGVVGLPVFSGATGGLAHFFGPTGGFLMGLLVMALVSGFFSDLAYSRQSKKEKLDKHQFILIIVGLFIASISIYAIGLPYLKFTLNLSWTKAFLLSVVPFIPGDILKIVVVALLANIFFLKTRKYFSELDQ
ncbi:MAG: biotin transporter BioY [Spirochaetia bacterium]|nr:biotin transporter BioY [Spirochaetia bacterium]